MYVENNSNPAMLLFVIFVTNDHVAKNNRTFMSIVLLTAFIEKSLIDTVLIGMLIASYIYIYIYIY